MSLLVAAALMLLQNGLAVNAQLDRANVEIDNNLQPNGNPNNSNKI